MKLKSNINHLSYEKIYQNKIPNIHDNLTIMKFISFLPPFLLFSSRYLSDFLFYDKV